MINKLHFGFNDETVLQRAFASVKEEQQKVGYYTLPQQKNETLLAYVERMPEHIETIAVIGIGGSALGAKAVYEFIRPTRQLARELYFFESTDPIHIHRMLDQIDLDVTHFIVISKSGTTVETMAIYKYILALQSDHTNYTFVTDPGSPLDRYAKTTGTACFHLPSNVGGRFSVLSAVGLLPLALCGIDISQLLKGAEFVQKSFFKQGYMHDTLLKKAAFYAKNHAQYHINCLFAYSEALQSFCQWYVQLWGESLGKRQRHSAFHVGLTPIGLIGPKDQHSFLQLIMEGTRDKSVTFLKVEDFQEQQMEVPETSLPHLKALDLLNGLSFNTLINMQCDSIVEALQEQEDIPLDIITIPRMDEYTMGTLIYYYELLTSLVGSLIDVNTYDQPGVEAGKKILKEKLTHR